MQYQYIVRTRAQIIKNATDKKGTYGPPTSAQDDRRLEAGLDSYGLSSWELVAIDGDRYVFKQPA